MRAIWPSTGWKHSKSRKTAVPALTTTVVTMTRGDFYDLGEGEGLVCAGGVAASVALGVVVAAGSPGSFFSR